jgi:predicted metalloprotease with PDZ domain
MHYIIKAENPNRQYLFIRAIFLVDGEQTTLQFPKWRPGRYELGNFAKNVKGICVYDAQGRKLKFQKTDTHQWLVMHSGVAKIVVEYEYYAADLNAGSTFLSSEMLCVNPVNCLIFIPGRETEKCTVQVFPQKGLNYVGTLDCQNGFIHSESYHDLVDSPFVYAKQMTSETYVYNEVEFRITFIGLEQVPWSRVLGDFQKFTKEQFDDFGHFPSNKFHFINIITPYPFYHGVEHRASTMIVLGPRYQIFGAYYDELLGISSHELYHVWNVKSIRSQCLYSYDYSKENLSDMGYLCEGITTYMGDYYLMKSGIWSLEKYLQEWTQVIQKHIDNWGRFNSSLAESSLDTWLDGYVPGAPGRKVSIYNEGAIFAFVTDIFIRSKTEGKKSLRDVMKFLYYQFYHKNKGVSNDDFVATVVAESGSRAYEDLFRSMLFERISYEMHIQKALELIRYSLVFETSHDVLAARLGIKITYENGFAKILSIYPESISDNAGLVIGDKILALNDFFIQNDLELWVKYFSDSPLKLLINRQGRVVHVELPVAQGDYFKKVSIYPLNNQELKTNQCDLGWSWSRGKLQ